VQVERVIRCPASAYQQGLCALVQRGLEQQAAGSAQQGQQKAGGVRGVSNSLMELRNICNHPFLVRRSLFHVTHTRQLLLCAC
jgi:hypothetical protein